jgi:cysteine desulfurase family protein (TIGR01976 family)
MSTELQSTDSMFCIDRLRQQFPALQRNHRGFPVAYFDGPGGTQVPVCVVQAMSDYLFHHNANDGWAYPTSLETDQVIQAARQTLADCLNASPSEIVFGQNMTSLTMHVAQAIGRDLRPGDELIVTELDHHANVDPWRQMAQDVGATVRVARMDTSTGQLDWQHLSDLFNTKTRLLAIGASSNALGTINDIHHATQMAHAVGALSYVDAVHYAPHHLVDVTEIDCDFLSCSAYKFYGPHIGVLYGKHEMLRRLPVHKLEPASDQAPKRLETGTQSFESMAGAAAAIDFIASLAPGSSRRQRLQNAYHQLHARSESLFRQLWEGLASHPLVTVFGPPPGDQRAPTVSFVVRGYTAQAISQLLAESGVFVSHGNFYALTVVRRLGYEDQGLVRVGLSCYSTAEEIERLLELLPKA